MRRFTFAIACMFSASAALLSPSANAQPLPGPGNTSEAVLGFDMWCLEIQLLPQARCESRRGDDLKAYAEYRATIERYQQQRDAQTRKEKELTDRLNRDPLDAARGGAGR